MLSQRQYAVRENSPPTKGGQGAAGAHSGLQGREEAVPAGARQGPDDREVWGGPHLPTCLPRVTSILFLERSLQARKVHRTQLRPSHTRGSQRRRNRSGTRGQLRSQSPQPTRDLQVALFPELHTPSPCVAPALLQDVSGDKLSSQAPSLASRSHRDRSCGVSALGPSSRGREGALGEGLLEQRKASSGQGPPLSCTLLNKIGKNSGFPAPAGLFCKSEQGSFIPLRCTAFLTL